MCTHCWCDEQLNSMCTLFGFYCRILAHGVALALVLASFAYREKAQTLSMYSLSTGVFVLLLESSWCYFHNKCLMNRGTLRLDSYMLRSVVYIVLASGGILINYYVEPQMDLFVMHIILGACGVLFGFAHAQRPDSIFLYHFDMEDQKRLQPHTEEEQPLNSNGGGASI